MNQPRLTWGADGWAATDGWELAYCIDAETREFEAERDVWVSAGTGMPALAFRDPPPPAQPGQAVIRTDAGWEHVDDYRGQTAYDKQTRAAVNVDALGPLPDRLTLLPPASLCDAWDDERSEWVADPAAERAQQLERDTATRDALMREANEHIAVLVDAVDLGMATDDEVVALTAWRQYRVYLARLDLSQQPIVWPSRPTH